MPEISLSVAEALDRLLSRLQVLPSEAVPLDDSLGRVLAERVSAPHDLPPFANSAMDGFAVRAEDTSGAGPSSPVRLRVMGDVAAGSPPRARVGAREAARIMTGGMIPEGADAVVPVEGTGEPAPMAGRPLPSDVEIRQEVPPGAWIRRPGLDLASGAMALEEGTVLGAKEIGLLAALGVGRPRVRRRARVAILSSGDELVDVESPLSAGKLRDANGAALTAAARDCGAEVLRGGVLRDNPESVTRGLRRAAEAGADLIVTSAGVSQGAFDFVRLVVEEQGGLEFWKVNIRPGKPLAVGQFMGRTFLGLPGNPVSALVTFEVFVRPALRVLHGARGTGRLRFEAELAEGIESDGRETYLRAVVELKDGGHRARLAGGQDSSVLSSLAAANALIVIPAGVRTMPEGARVRGWFIGL
jgi:molybdopterin molybdotransferase